MKKDQRAQILAAIWKSLLPMTDDSPLLAVGTVQRRSHLTGKSERGPWEMWNLEIRGSDGRMVIVTINDPKTAPAIGEAICLPVFVGTNGRLREARNLAQDF